MAKKLNEIITMSKETQYASGKTPVLTSGLGNNAIKLLPVSNNGAIQYNIQRLKRTKAKDFSTTTQAGTDLITNYNALEATDWDTVATNAGTERFIGMKINPVHKFDVNSVGDADAFVLAQKTNAVMLELEEKAQKKLWDSAVSKGTLDLATGGTALLDKVNEAKMSIQLKVDDFKAYSDTIIAIAHPLVMSKLAQIEGVVYQNGSNTFGSNAKTLVFNGLEIVEASVLNTISPGAGKVAGLIIYDKEAYFNKGLKGAIPFDDNLQGNRFVGERYTALDAVVDAARIVKFDIATTIPVTDLANKAAVTK